MKQKIIIEQSKKDIIDKQLNDIEWAVTKIRMELDIDDKLDLDN